MKVLTRVPLSKAYPDGVLAKAAPRPWGRLALGALALAGAAGMVYRLGWGLGAATNLSDGWPWGWWIAFDVMAGVALAAGAFVVAAWVHVFGRERYAALARPAVLTGFLGYLMVIVGLLMDLGRPYRIWHPVVMWQPHSVMFEVAWCVLTYTTVLALEFSPVALEGVGWSRAARRLKRVTVPLVILGVVCSVLHQSSLGSLLLIAPYRMHPLWYSPLLPVLYLSSAVAAGLAMVQLEASAASRVYGHPVSPAVMEGLARGLAWAAAINVALRLGDWVARGTGPWVAPLEVDHLLAALEVAVGMAAPALILAISACRRRAGVRAAASVAVVAGVVLHRIDSALVAMRHSAGASYWPSPVELLVSAGIVAAGILAYDWVARHWPLFEAARPAAEAAVAAPRRPAEARAA